MKVTVAVFEDETGGWVAYTPPIGDASEGNPLPEKEEPQPIYRQTFELVSGIYGDDVVKRKREWIAALVKFLNESADAIVGRREHNALEERMEALRIQLSNAAARVATLEAHLGKEQLEAINRAVVAKQSATKAAASRRLNALAKKKGRKR